jgi:dipeptidyl aminopeptidase/acylaminoacyl peptidase
VVEKAVFSNVELNTTLAAPTKPVLYSTLATQSIASTDRRVVHVTPIRIEALNRVPDGKSLIYNSGGRLYRIPGATGKSEVIDTGFANRCNNDHEYPPTASSSPSATSRRGGGSRSSTPSLSLGGRRSSLRRTVLPTGTGGRRTARRSRIAPNGEFDVYTIPAEGGKETRLTTAKGLDDGPEFSPDGKHIFFNSDRTGRMQIWRMKTDGSEQEQVFEDESNNWFPHISPDGRQLVFLSYGKDVKAHPAGKDVTLRRMTLETKKIDVLGRFLGGQGTINVLYRSPDGIRIAFVTYQLVP